MIYIVKFWCLPLNFFYKYVGILNDKSAIVCLLPGTVAQMSYLDLVFRFGGVGEKPAKFDNNFLISKQWWNLPRIYSKIDLDFLSINSFLHIICYLEKICYIWFVLGAAQDYIYWVETSPNYRIARIKRDLTGHEVILSDEIGRITDIAVDWIAGTVHRDKGWMKRHQNYNTDKMFHWLEVYIMT